MAGFLGNFVRDVDLTLPLAHMHPRFEKALRVNKFIHTGTQVHLSYGHYNTAGLQ